MTPYDVVARHATPVPTTKLALLRAVRAQELAALAAPPRVAVATVQDVRFVSDRTREVYAALAARGTEVTLYARDLPAYVAEGVRGVALDDDDPLVDVWSVLLLSDEAPLALAATDRLDADCADLAREFDTATVHDREVVAAALAVLPG